MTWDKPYIPRLPMINEEDRRHMNINTISSSVLQDMMINMEDFMVIDCRFEYEFEGGHI